MRGLSSTALRSGGQAERPGWLTHSPPRAVDVRRSYAPGQARASRARARRARTPRAARPAGPRRRTTRIRPARWCSERRTARRSAGTGTGRMCGGNAASPSSSTDQRGVRPRRRHSPPPASARTTRARGREARHRPARAHDDRARGQRAAEPAAGERGHRAVAEPGLAPPPLARERAAPVLLDVGVPAVERHRLAAEHRLPAHARAEHGGMPVLRQPRHGLRDAERAERPARPRHPALEHRLQARVRAEVDRDPPLGPAQHRRAVALPRGRAEPVRLGRRGGRACASARSRPGARRARRPPTARRAPGRRRTARRRSARRRVAQPPVVALHRDAVRAPRIAERKVGPGPAVGVEQPAHTAGGRRTSYGSQSRFQNASRPCSRMYASSLRWIGYTPWMLTGSASPTSMPR